MSPTLRLGIAACTTATALVLTALTPATATASTQLDGQLTLYSDTGFQQPTKRVTYPDCAAFLGSVPGQRTGSFRNTPLPGCQVALHTLAGTYVLCAGSGVVPPAYRQAILYEIRTGPTTPCPV